jgi:hypothetical protein
MVEKAQPPLRAAPRPNRRATEQGVDLDLNQLGAAVARHTRCDEKGLKEFELSIRKTGRRFVAGSVLAASSLAFFAPAGAQTPETPGEADFLFVQTSMGLTFDKATNKLTLTGVSPVTAFFTDRPERIAGNMKTVSFIPFWSEGKDSFKSNPPNADALLLRGRCAA